ncbi:MAG TPA: dTDP-glucose 4,6-dehydratase [Desulfatirhabdiaceae bacterium]|nr:dTDP-glucose 4,6-dehydratase [Desulfatirhabdiaceae bacterium]
MKNILVTGGSGFIGSNFIRYLLAQPDFDGRVVNMDCLTYAGNPENLDGIDQAYPNRYIFVKSDICDAQAVESTFRKYDIDAVCHFAAESHVDRSIVGPDDFIRTNIMGTFTLLEISRKYHDQLKLFHHISTDEVYGSLGTDGFFTECTPYNPSSPYSASKAASDHLVMAYHRTYGLPVTLSNCSNNYGPYQFPEKLIPLMVLNAMDGKCLPVYGNGLNVRDWLYVADHCAAVWLIMKQGRRGETYNIGGRCEIANLSVVRTICDLLDANLSCVSIQPRRNLITFVKDRPGHDLRYAIDCCKLENELGWTPVESFESGIAKTIAWYQDHSEWVSHVRSGQYLKWIETHYDGQAG